MKPAPETKDDNVIRRPFPNHGHDMDGTLALAQGKLEDGIVIGWDKEADTLRYFVSRGLLDPTEVVYLIENFKLSFLNRPPLIDEDD